MSNGFSIEVVEARSLAAVVADEIVACLTEAIDERGKASLVLAGGSTPASIYRLLARPPRVNEIAWDKLDIFWGDERWVPLDDTQSNHNMAQETFLSQVESLGVRIHPVDTSLKNAKAGAKAYDKTLRSVLGSDDPKFDLVLLGMGSDGHTASLFPGSPVLEDASSLAFAVKHPEDKSMRVTLSSEVLFNARSIHFIVAGEGKKDIVQQVLEGNQSAKEFPAMLFRKSEERVTWFLDSAAAQGLTKQGLTKESNK